jgi:dehydrogenase/reductase SDR family member 12
MRPLLDQLLDPTVVLSFDRSGYRRHSRSFSPNDLAVDLSLRTCLVTGANSGIGRATAAGLARLGAQVWLLCRNHERGEAARDALRAETGNPRIELAQVDLSDLGSIDRVVADIGVSAVDVLVHNAGVLPDTRSLTRDGLELTLATHIAGPLRLTRGLRPRMRHGSRVIWVSSGGMYTQKLSVDAMLRTDAPFDGVVQYAQTKRAQVVLAAMQAERVQSRGIDVHAMHPGWADTDAVRSSLPRFHRVTRAILRTAEEGADTAIWLAACPRLAGQTGGFWFDRALQNPHKVPWTRESAADREGLWKAAHAWAGIPAE